MGLRFILLVVASSILTSGTFFVVGAKTANFATPLSRRNVQAEGKIPRETRVLRSNEKRGVGDIEDDEERTPTLAVEGIFRDAKATRKWLHFWLNTGESAESVATKLGPENLAALPVYRTMVAKAMLGKTDGELLFFRNYKAFRAYPAILRSVQLGRVKHWANLNKA
ncbi:secreted RxLR effector peptide protein, putative [Phytophthora infestans T30-4]|uniref:RxLR effector protein n=1 Tax=Phytophthora infestans (strain T30-4) TaxID=403677 RepID=D0N8E5_PHYIT|nr:secreted RxLR effector peptide protein, putative [Phytophthora infestans T30-4]EEY53830.1 secreted RxLR effector peptide protein, putative [Phytophthora infestans T30-4]|eukprot:XP_002904461.1 secreted RxLR effector peptide protein, putative [Phytophthora infestans T30-4]